MIFKLKRIAHYESIPPKQSTKCSTLILDCLSENLLTGEVYNASSHTELPVIHIINENENPCSNI